jgi:hypothetical protein
MAPEAPSAIIAKLWRAKCAAPRYLASAATIATGQASMMPEAATHPGHRSYRKQRPISVADSLAPGNKPSNVEAANRRPLRCWLPFFSSLISPSELAAHVGSFSMRLQMASLVGRSSFPKQSCRYVSCRMPVPMKNAVKTRQIRRSGQCAPCLAHSVIPKLRSGFPHLAQKVLCMQFCVGEDHLDNA